jgi:hypothetical protein
MKLNIISFGVLSLLLSTTFLMAGEQIQASATPSTDQVVVGKSVEIPVIIDVSNLSGKLGSFTATLEWNPDMLEYESYSGGTTLGFESPVVNEMHVKKGRLIFAHAYPFGAEGEINVLNVTMKVVGKEGLNSALALSFSAMAAAYTFEDLLPKVEVAEGQLEVTNTEIPAKFGIESHPNPFNPSTEIRYQLPQAVDVRIVIYNVLGQQVKELVNRNQEPGSYTVKWDSENEQGVTMPSGMYFLRMKAGSFIANRKLLLLK